mgnify:CR=1 FL=1
MKVKIIPVGGEVHECCIFINPDGKRPVSSEHLKSCNFMPTKEEVIKAIGEESLWSCETNGQDPSKLYLIPGDVIESESEGIFEVP